MTFRFTARRALVAMPMSPAEPANKSSSTTTTASPLADSSVNVRVETACRRGTQRRRTTGRASTARTSSSAVACALAVVLSGGGAAEAARPVPRILHASMQAQPGGELNVAAEVRARRRAVPAGRLSLWLARERRGARRTPGAVRLAETAHKRLPRGRFWTVAVTKLPAAIPVGRRWLVACDGRGRPQRCSRPRKLRVVADATTAAERIAADRAAGRLTEDGALVQQLLVAYGSRAARAAYRGLPTGVDGHTVAREVSARWPALPARDRKAVAPHLLPPTSPRSAFARRDEGRSRRRAQASMHDRGWQHRLVDGGRIKVLWPRDDLMAKGTAARIAEHAAGVLRQLTALMGRGPVSDAGVHRAPLPRGYEAVRPHDDGGDGALDIYVATHLGGPRGSAMWAQPYPPYRAPSPRPPHRCPAAPAWIGATPNEPYEDRPAVAARQHVAHEIFHTIQFAFERAWCGSPNVRAVDESAATWVEDLLYPKDDLEHRHDADLRSPGFFPREYDGWTFFWSVAKREGPGFMRRIYEIAENEGSVAAVDFGISGGFAKAWPAYALQAFNQEPVTGSFHDLDRLPTRPEPDIRRLLLPLTGGGSGIERIPRDKLHALSRSYEKLVVVDPGIREVRLRNAYAGVPGHGMQAMLQLTDGSWRTEDWTGRAEVELCRDRRQEDVSQIILVETYIGYEPFESAREHVVDSRTTCGDFPWRYEVLDASFEQTTTAARPGALCGDFGGTSGSKRFTGTFAASQPSSIERQRGGALSGRIVAQTNAIWTDHHLKGCRSTDDGYVACSTRAPDQVPGNGGRWLAQFAVRAESTTARTAQLTWSLSNASVGFVDAGNEECNVVEIVGALPYEDLLQDVPLSKLASKEPQTYTFSLARHFDRTLTGDPASIDGTWEYRMTVRRVE